MILKFLGAAGQCVLHVRRVGAECARGVGAGQARWRSVLSSQHADDGRRRVPCRAPDLGEQVECSGLLRLGHPRRIEHGQGGLRYGDHRFGIVYLHEYSGLAAVSAVDVSASAAGTPVSMSSGAVRTTQAACDASSYITGQTLYVDGGWACR